MSTFTLSTLSYSSPVQIRKILYYFLHFLYILCFMS
uniref:Uncharacterized protein n=1 Tax=Siphoviridae sp. ctD6g5 TaxID=2826196 RepID=A0A8S5MRN8_9CAUD|nr:MAG TPA: Protein of unknown function (DUF2973) [Siphoviridae sp. ctD6g5]